MFGTTPVKPIPLESRHVLLRPPKARFVDQIYELASIGELPWLWRGGRETPDAFRAAVLADVHVIFAIQDRRTGEDVGIISAHDLNPFHRFTYMTFALLPDYKLRVWPLEATVLFANYLFVKYNLRNIHGRSVAGNFSQFKSGAGRFFEVEGCLKGHYLVNSEPQDVHLLTLSKARWLEEGVPLLERITTHPGAAARAR